MTQIKSMTYTKDNGDVSERDVVVISSPRENYLVYDVTSLSQDERTMLLHYLESIEAYRDETMEELKSVTSIRQEKLWRSFKPDGIKWKTEEE